MIHKKKKKKKKKKRKEHIWNIYPKMEYFILKIAIFYSTHVIVNVFF